MSLFYTIIFSFIINAIIIYVLYNKFKTNFELNIKNLIEWINKWFNIHTKEIEDFKTKLNKTNELLNTNHVELKELIDLSNIQQSLELKKFFESHWERMTQQNWKIYNLILKEISENVKPLILELTNKNSANYSEIFNIFENIKQDNLSLQELQKLILQSGESQSHSLWLVNKEICSIKSQLTDEFNLYENE